MSVPTWKRKPSSAEFIYQVYQLNIRLGEILANKPQKYKQNYTDHVVKTAMDALKHLQIADSIYLSNRIRTRAEECQAGRIPLRTVLQSYRCRSSYAQKCQCYDAVGNMDGYFTSVFGDAIRQETGCATVRYGHPTRIRKENEYEQASGY